MQPFIHLHVHSQYSILDGQASIPALVEKAMKDGMKGLALTDHGNMFGIKEFFNLVKKKNGAVKDDIKKAKKRIEAIESGTEEAADKEADTNVTANVAKMFFSFMIIYLLNVKYQAFSRRLRIAL